MVVIVNPAKRTSRKFACVLGVGAPTDIGSARKKFYTAKKIFFFFFFLFSLLSLDKSAF